MALCRFLVPKLASDHWIALVVRDLLLCAIASHPQRDLLLVSEVCDLHFLFLLPLDWSDVQKPMARVTMEIERMIRPYARRFGHVRCPLPDAPWPRDSWDD